MQRLVNSLVAFAFVVSSGPLYAKDKDTRASMMKRAAAGTVVTLTNGVGDGKVTIGVDGYGSFGTSTPAGGAYYDPAGPRESASTVYESAVYFSPIGGFLSTDDIGTGTSLPPVEIEQPDSQTAISTFTVGKYAFRLTQRVLATTGLGSTLEQTYEITNNTRKKANVLLARHVDGDLYFEGDFNNDFAGVSSDSKTLYEFDTGDDPASPTTFLGITSEGGVDAGSTIQPYRYSDDIISAVGIPSTDIGLVSGDDDGNQVTDAGYDVTLTQQRRIQIASGATGVYVTKTIFGEGSISGVTAAVTGCFKLNGDPLPKRTVTATQSGSEDLTTKTDTGGCFGFDGLLGGKSFQIKMQGPKIPNN